MPPLAMVSAINVLSKAVSMDSLSVYVQIRFCGYFKVSRIVIGIPAHWNRRNYLLANSNPSSLL